MSENDKPSTPPASKQDIMREIGQALAERRKARGLTIEKVGQILKIRLPYLKAMEQGDWGELPGEVYARGFVKRYAVYLGMDSEKLLSRYLTDKTPDVEISGDDGKSTGSDASKGVLVAVGVAAVFLIVLIKLARNEKGAPAPEKAETVAASTAPAAAAKPASQVVQTGETAPADSHRLEVYSPYPLWVRVNTEDKNFEGFIPDNATWTWTAKGKFTVRLGHNRKVSMAFDGVPVPLTENQKKVDLPE
jgi:hypothetical protein